MEAGDGFAVIAAESLEPGAPVATTLAGLRLVLWRSADGTPHVWADQCPHRGAQLSLGTIVGGAMQCPYHGWRCGPDAQCTHWPAHPNEQPPAIARAKAYRATEAYGLVWACLGEPAHPIPIDILMVASPLDATHCRVWKVNVFRDSGEENARQTLAYSRAAMLQDIPIVESQWPKPLPLDPRAELHQRADRLAAAYRRWLKDRGWTCGVTP